MKRIITAALGALIIASSFSAAEARPRHKHHHRHHHQRVVAAPQPQQHFGFMDGFRSGFSGGFSAGSGVVSRAREYIGSSARQVGVRTSLWCSAFMRKLTGASGVDDRAISWAKRPHIAPQIGAVAVMRHHVGVVSGFTKNGDPIIISGNHGNRVAESVYSRSRVIAWVSAS